MPGAAWFPAGTPTEARRVEHPAGFSIVAPSGWTAKVTIGEKDLITLTPRSQRRFEPWIEVELLDGPPADATDWTVTSLQGQDAFSKAYRLGKFAVEERLIERGGQWFRLRVFVHEDGKPPQVLVQYFETFQANAARSRR